MTVALINGTEIFYLAGHPDFSEREFSSAQNVRISGRVSVQVRARIRALAVEHIDRGNLESTLTFSATRQFASEAAALAYAARIEDAAELSGILVLRAETPGDADDSFVYNCRAVVPPPVPEVTGRACILHYTVSGGAFVPQGATAYPPAPALPATYTRITEENGPNGMERWFEAGFDSAEILTGSAEVGWAGENITYSPLWSEDLTTWITGRFIDCAGSPEDNGDGTWRYWCRSVYPANSETSTGQLWAENIGGDVRNNPFTSLVIEGIIQALPNFPYTMPDDAAQMQADLRAAGWTGATVESVTGPDWRIEIPNVEGGSFFAVNRVYWPGYYISTPFGAQLVDGMSFSGEYVNAADVRTKLPNQFFRLAVTAL